MNLSAHILLCLASAAAAQTAAPTTIYLHGNVLTSAKSTARSEALAVTGGTITAVGLDAQILALKGPQTQLVDLHGAFVMPGFNDAHTHIAMAGQQKLAVDLDNTPSLADMLERIRIYTAAARPGTWILGGGWDHTKWASGKLPTRLDLDKVTAGHSAIFYRTDGHILVANSAALAAAGITASTPDPMGGKIDRDATGAATGIIREASAIALIAAKVPPPDAVTRRKALDLAIADAVSHGVTSLQDNSTWDDWLVLEQMEQAGQLPIRIAEWLDFNAPLDVLQAHRASHDANDPLLHLTMLKGFMDGSLGSRTAALAAPYSDDPENSGIPRYDQGKLNAMTTERVAAGFDIGFHAIGDQANAMALNAFEAAGVGTQKNGARYRIEHAQVLLPADFDRMARLHIIASMQPSHLLTDMAWAGDRLGPDRAQYAYAWRSMLDHNITLALGTDYPVESISPFRGIYSAVTRMNEAGTKLFHVEQFVTMPEALYAYTEASAFAEHRETLKGRLEPGMAADFVVLDRDLTAIPATRAKEILATRVLRTVVAGKTVYEAAAQKLPTPVPAIPEPRKPTPETE